MVRCPDCDKLHTADDAQLAGAVSIVCRSCGWHGYIDETDYHVKRGDHA